jgi:hypothetical protein
MNSIDLFGNTKESKLDDLFSYWRSKGYPNYNINNYNKREELNNLIIFDEKTIFKNGVIQQTMHSCGFLWCYFPEWINVKYGKDKSIKELWDDDIKLKELLRKTYEYSQKHNEKFVTENRVRQNSKVYLSKQSVSNFRPSVAKFIYNTYGNKGEVWDMSCGWGGRLFGFMASNCKKYIGTEPNKKTFEGLNKLKSDFNLNKEIELHCVGSEVYEPTPNSLDLCFTSPPYFDTEKYSDEETQSYIKYPTKSEWINGFYRKTISNCCNGLKVGGYMIINIADTTKYKFLEEETIKISKEIGFELITTHRMILSSISGKGIKYEPIFVFQKQQDQP